MKLCLPKQKFTRDLLIEYLGIHRSRKLSVTTLSLFDSLNQHDNFTLMKFQTDQRTVWDGWMQHINYFFFLSRCHIKHLKEHVKRRLKCWWWNLRANWLRLHSCEKFASLIVLVEPHPTSRPLYVIGFKTAISCARSKAGDMFSSAPYKWICGVNRRQNKNFRHTPQ